MMQSVWSAAAGCTATAFVAFVVPAAAQQQHIGDPPEALNMRLVGYNDLQARSAYQPTIANRATAASPISAITAATARRRSRSMR